MSYEKYFNLMRAIQKELAIIALEAAALAKAIQGDGESKQLQSLLRRQTNLLETASEYQMAVEKAYGLAS